MASVLAGVRPPERVDLAADYLRGVSGRQSVLAGQQQLQQGQMALDRAPQVAAQQDQQHALQMQRGQQQVSEADFLQAVQKARVENRLARQIRNLPLGEREQFKQSLNPDMLQSLGIDPQEVAQVDVSDQSLDNIIAQTEAALAAVDGQGAPAGVREFREIAGAAGLQEGDEDFQRAARVRLGLEGRASGAGMQTFRMQDSRGQERIFRFSPQDGTLQAFDGQGWVTAGPQEQKMVASGQAQTQPVAGMQEPMGAAQEDRSDLFVGRPIEEEAALVEAAKLRGRQTAEADPVEGSELHRSREAEAARSEAARRSAIDYAQTVTQDVGIALDELNRMGPLSSMDNMAGGRLAQWRSNIERTPEYNVRQFVESALSNVTLDTMNRMRESSPAGATGFGNMSERQMNVIRGVLGQWNPGLPKEHQEYILHRIGNFYMDVVMGTEEERAEAVRDGRMTPEENEAIQALYYPETRDVRGRRLQNEAPPVNDRGWQLMQDAAGNRAYVGPNGEIEEL